MLCSFSADEQYASAHLNSALIFMSTQQLKLVDKIVRNEKYHQELVASNEKSQFISVRLTMLMNFSFQNKFISISKSTGNCILAHIYQKNI